jgi:TetR/AcrR family transcriptional regulator, cholesterol catabolism regulator
MGNQKETQKKLTKAAIEFFATKGYKGTTIRDIAKATGMTVSTTYYHFGSKNGLLLAIINQLAAELQTELEGVCKLDLEPLERLKKLVATHLERVARNGNNAAILFYDEDDLTPPTNKIVKKVQLKFLNVYRRELENLRAAGYLRSSNTTVIAFHIIALVEWHIRWYKPKGRLSLEEVKKEALDFILGGILKNTKTRKMGGMSGKR